MSQKVNLNGYFERIAFVGSIAPTLATLEMLLALHPASIPFENLNPVLGLPVSLELGKIEQKLVRERRGGYCYEHNLLLQAVLQELDYSVRALAGRVVTSTEPEQIDPVAHHMLLAVDVGGASYLVDAGFGGLTPTGPLKLKADTEQKTQHETYRLLGGDPEWRLEVKVEDQWKALYVFDMAEKTVEDYAASNAFLSSDPASIFTRELRVALSPAGRRIGLRGNRLNIHPQGEPSQTRDLVSVVDLREVLSGTFGLQLPNADLLDPKLEVVLADAGVVEV